MRPKVDAFNGSARELLARMPGELIIRRSMTTFPSIFKEDQQKIVNTIFKVFLPSHSPFSVGFQRELGKYADSAHAYRLQCAISEGSSRWPLPTKLTWKFFLASFACLYSLEARLSFLCIDI